MKASQSKHGPVNSEGPEGKKKPEKKRRVPVAVWVIAGILLVLICAVGLVFNHYYSKMNINKVLSSGAGLISPEEEDWKEGLSSEELAGLDDELRKNLESNLDWDFNNADVTNILLIGVDNDYLPGMNDLGNADGLVLVSINKTSQKVVMTSFMRDIYVAMPGAFNTKITMSYHYGGVPVLLDTVEANFGINVDNYILVNYLNVIDIVDAVGGVTLDVSASELYFMQEKIHNLNYLAGNDWDANIIPTQNEGTLLLNGVQTAAYMRIRQAGNGDFDRTNRARDVLLAIKDKVVDMTLLELNKLADVVLPCITTDLTQGEILSLLMNAPSYLKYAVDSNRIPIDGAYDLKNIYGSVVVIDYEVNRRFLYESIYGTN